MLTSGLEPLLPGLKRIMTIDKPGSSTLNYISIKETGNCKISHEKEIIFALHSINNRSKPNYVLASLNVDYGLCSHLTAVVRFHTRLIRDPEYGSTGYSP